MLKGKLIEDLQRALTLDEERRMAIAQPAALKSDLRSIRISNSLKQDVRIMRHTLLDPAVLNPYSLEGGVGIDLAVNMKPFSRDILLLQTVHND